MTSNNAKRICQCQAIESVTKGNRIIWFFRCTNSFNGISKPVTVAGDINDYPDEDAAKLEALQRCEAWVDHCLPGETLVSMEDGSQKEISSLAIGDRILSTDDGENTFVDTVTGVQESKHEVTLEVSLPGGEKFTASPTQPLLSSKGLVTVADLVVDKEADIKTGHKLTESVKVSRSSIDTLFHEEPVTLYSLATKRSSFFFVGTSAIIVKCKGPCGGGPMDDRGVCL